MKTKWKIYKRRGRAFRHDKLATEWVRIKSFDNLKDAKSALSILEEDADLGNGLKKYQYKIVEKNYKKRRLPCNRDVVI